MVLELSIIITNIIEKKIIMKYLIILSIIMNTLFADISFCKNRIENISITDTYLDSLNNNILLQTILIEFNSCGFNNKTMIFSKDSNIIYYYNKSLDSSSSLNYNKSKYDISSQILLCEDTVKFVQIDGTQCFIDELFLKLFNIEKSCIINTNYNSLQLFNEIEYLKDKIKIKRSYFYVFSYHDIDCLFLAPF
jgi:hypothetical protein